MNTIETIRAEIKRRYAYQKQMYERKKPDGRPNDGWSESLAIMGELEELLSFLDTLEEPEAEFCKTHCKGYRETGGKCFFGGSCDAKRKATQEPEVDLDGKVTFDCISKQVTMTIQELINYYIDTECCNVAEECGF